MVHLGFIKGEKPCITKKFNTKDFSIAHGCNLKDNWGGGVAKLLDELYPRARLESEKFIDKKLGDVSLSKKEDKTNIFNLYTQSSGGSGSFSYKALYESVIKMLSIVTTIHGTLYPRHNHAIQMPLIGSGIAGGDSDLCLFTIRLAIYDFINSGYMFNTTLEIDVDIVIWDDTFNSMKFFEQQCSKVSRSLVRGREELDPAKENFNESQYTTENVFGKLSSPPLEYLRIKL